MFPSARQAIACVLFIFIAAICSQSQVAPVKTATVSGKVTLKTKALPGIVVAARNPNRSGPDRSRYRATTDQSGNYRITNLPPGTYQVGPITPGLVSEDVLSQKPVVIEEGDNVEDLNFSLVRGGVITGKITDADGRPVVEESIFFQPTDGVYAQTPYFHSGIVTDDRGVYRAFGLRSGKYKVYVGQGDNRLPGGHRLYQQTFYPSVTDAAKATEVEVTEGSEASDIDIRMGRPFTAFNVSGKIVDSETGKPVPNIPYGIYQRTSEGAGQSTGGARSNANGEFKFNGVMPGKYSIFVSPEENVEIRAQPVPFEIIDQDVTGLVLKTVKAATVSGVVVIEGVEDLAAFTKGARLVIHAMPERVERDYSGVPFGMTAPDGSFKITPLAAGIFNLGIGVHGPGVNKQVSLVRIESDGNVQSSRIVVKEGEQITGLRLIAKVLGATIRGQVKIEDGELPPNARMQIWVELLDENRSGYRVANNSRPQIDARGKFLIDGIGGGTYEINVAVFESGRLDSNRIFKQQVTVADNSVSEVTMTIKLKP
jgi:protocatechuate 3,4-dioxygenase beta subunit